MINDDKVILHFRRQVSSVVIDRVIDIIDAEEEYFLTSTNNRTNIEFILKTRNNA